jgi:hypothetical protein
METGPAHPGGPVSNFQFTVSQSKRWLHFTLLFHCFLLTAFCLLHYYGLICSRRKLSGNTMNISVITITSAGIKVNAMLRRSYRKCMK